MNKILLRTLLNVYQKSTAEELLNKELPLKFVEVDEEQYRLVLSNQKAMGDGQAQLGIGSFVIGTIQSLKPYGAFIDIDGINGLIIVSRILLPFFSLVTIWRCVSFEKAEMPILFDYHVIAIILSVYSTFGFNSI